MSAKEILNIFVNICQSSKNMILLSPFNDVIKLGENIAQNPENLVSSPSGRQVFEKDVIIGEQMVRVRVVHNPLGNLRSVHIRY